MINITIGLLQQYGVKPTINTTTMTVEQMPVSKLNIESRLCDVAAAGAGLAARILRRTVVMAAGYVATPRDLEELIPKQRQPDVPPLSIEVELRRAEVINNCQAAFALAIEKQIDSMDSNVNYILPSPDQFKESEYICIQSGKNTALFLHRPSLNYQNLSKYPYWLRERVSGDEQVLGLPTTYLKDYGIDAQGYIEERELVSSTQLVDRRLEPYDALPYYQALTPIQLGTMKPAV